MALKVLMLRSKLTPLQQQMTQLTQARDAFAQREAELEADIAAAQTDEERSVVEEAVTAFETERSANQAEITRVQGLIDAMEEEIRSLEQAQTPPAAPAAEQTERRMSPMPIENTERRWLGLTYAERDALLTRDDVRDFLQQVRSMRAAGGSVNGAALGIPDGFMPILRDLTYQESRLLGYITMQHFAGTTRQNIAGVAPEGIWTEMDGALNELELDFHQLTMDGWMVGGYMAIANSVLADDSDLQLATTILTSLAASIAKALDKAIVYGTGGRMPVGFVTRLAASSQPTWWGTNQGSFTDLHTSHVLKLDLGQSSGTNFFAKLVTALGVAKPNFSDGRAVWCMNRKTHIDLMSRALDFDSAAAIVAGINGTMPVVGGDIVELDFMPDYEIAGGFLSLQRGVEREGVTLDTSTQVRWLQNQTCYKVLARYDMKPAIGEAFVLVNYNNVEPTTSATFGKDYANADIGTLIVTTAAGGSGKTTVTVAGADSGATLKYRLGGMACAVTNGEKLGTDWKDITSGAAVAAAAGQTITVAEVDGAGKATKVGSSGVTVGS